MKNKHNLSATYHTRNSLLWKLRDKKRWFLVQYVTLRLLKQQKAQLYERNKFNVATLVFMSNREEQVSYIPAISLSW